MDPLFLSALVAGGSYTFAAWAEWDAPWTIAWKGLGVALLALWVWRRTAGRDGHAMAAVLGFGALGDVLLAIAFNLGAIAFLAGHLIAIWVYVRHRRCSLVWMAIAATGIAGVGYALAGSADVALYAAALGAMAGAAWASGLPRRIPAGATLFVLSDLLIFARLGPLWDSGLPTPLVWPLYFVGQALIAHGAVAAFGRDEALDVRRTEP